MLDIQLIRDNPEVVREASRQKNVDAPVDEILRLDTRRREFVTQVDRLKADRNAGSKLVGKTKDLEERNRRIAEMRELGDRIDALDGEIRTVDEQLRELMLTIPNIPDPDVPVGSDETANEVGPTHGRIREFDFGPLPHWDLAEHLGIIDFERGVKVAGARGYVLRGDGSRLQRALITWMLDVHIREHGYSEVTPPYMVLGEMLVGTGNLPKFAETLYKDRYDDKWLIPTAEVPVTNLYRDEILSEDQLPIYHVAHTPCFRREQISAGRDVRGIKRVYQFDKVEMVKFVHPDASPEELDRLVREALDIVERLDLPYRILDLSTGDMSFASAHTYDIETYAPGSEEWLEISSCSNMRDFQARRMNIRYRPEEGKRPQLLHTLNGSGLALPRTIIAIMENYQTVDREIIVPEALRPYMGGQERIDVQPPIGAAESPIEV
ncbi:MAG TPA: serine--tRNA ligase [Thermomicrobiales bacterium]|nr:serine--tRNA ligase [Thermomicrobiales bacterium]